MSLEKLAAAKEFDIEVYSRAKDLRDENPKSETEPGARAYVIKDKEFYVYESPDTAPGDNDTEGWYPAQAVNRSLTDINEDLTALEKRANPNADLPDGVSFQGHDNDAHDPDFVEVDDFNGHGNTTHFPNSKKAYATESYADSAYSDSDAVDAADSELDDHDSLSKLSTAVSGKASDNHGNGAHSATYATETYVDNLDTGADDNHGNESHSATFATTSWVSNNYASDSHNNNDHSETYATTNYVDNKVSSVDPGISHPGETAAESNIDVNDNNLTNVQEIHTDIIKKDNGAAVNFKDGFFMNGYATWHKNILVDEIQKHSSYRGDITVREDFDMVGNAISNVDSMSVYNINETDTISNNNSNIYVISDNAELQIGGSVMDASTYIGDSYSSNEDWTLCVGSLGSGGNGDALIKGDLSVSGNISADSVGSSVKSFIIDHPSKEGYELEHTSYEGPTSGGLIYRDRVEVVNGTGDPDFPEYITEDGFGGDWVTSITPAEKITQGYYLDTGEWTLYADEDGEYDVMIVGQRTDDTALEGRGGITERQNDETWDMAADRYYGGANDIRGIETARDVEDMRDKALVSHAQKEDKQTEFTPRADPMGADPEVTSEEEIESIKDAFGVSQEEAAKIFMVAETNNLTHDEAYDKYARNELVDELISNDDAYPLLNRSYAEKMAGLVLDDGMSKSNAYKQVKAEIEEKEEEREKEREKELEEKRQEVLDE